MGRLGSEMGTGEIDLTVSDMDLAEEPGRLVEVLEGASAKLEDLPFVSIHSVSRRPEDVEAALQGTYRLRDERFTLSPPVDWWDEPYRAPGERGFFQNSFVFADPLLADPRFPEVLAPLAAIFADWLATNPQSGAANPHRYAWHDHAAAGRITVMAFVLREGVRRGLLDSTVARTLAAGVLEHARYLLAEENYAAHYNHGFASDAALTLAARSLAPAPQATAWAEVAERRFAAVLDHMIDGADAVHLEHSPYYHWNIHGALSRFAAAGLFEGLDLAGLARRMEESGAWLIAPDGTLPPIGDTPFGERPPPVVSAMSASLSGMRVFPTAGYAVVRAGGSALIVTAAHHPTAHKHADDGSFCLYEDGQPLILDSGDPGHDYESAERGYGTSPAAHATICVDDFDWARGAPPHGSGMLASAEWDGLYALLTRNPGAVPGGGAARRALVYAPGRFLLVIDDVEAGTDSRLVRSLPLAPGLDATLTARGRVEIEEGGHTVARLVQLTPPDAPLDGVEVVFGRRLPELGGFSFPSPDESRPSCDVRLCGAAGHPRAFAVLMHDTGTGEPPAMVWTASGSRVDVEISGLTESTLAIRIGEDSVGLGSSG
jgi:Heparinase II/III-like protein/Heparinase II/III N-terminus